MTKLATVPIYGNSPLKKSLLHQKVSGLLAFICSSGVWVIQSSKDYPSRNNIGPDKERKYLSQSKLMRALEISVRFFSKLFWCITFCYEVFLI